MSQSPHLHINLASEPFRKDRALLVASGVVAGLLVFLLALLSVTIVREREAARESRARIAGLESQLRAVQQEEAKLQARLREPANETVLDRSVFLNALLLRKGISWTKLFSDLAEVMPHSVRLVSVRPFVTSDNRVQLEMIVGAQDPAPVIELLKRLESSSVFGSTAVQAEQPPSQNEPLFRYRVSVNYAQKL
jgi:type IV pilus assembly protein PilN